MQPDSTPGRGRLAAQGRWRLHRRTRGLAVGLLILSAACQQSTPAPVVWTEEEFQQRVLGASTPVLVACVTDPASQTQPVRNLIDAVAEEFGARLERATIDVSVNNWFKRQYRLGNAPALLLFHDGQEVDRYVGALRVLEAKRWCRDNLEQLVHAAAADADLPEIEEVELTTEDFDARLKELPGVVLVDFWAPWCGPCRFIAPQLRQLGREQHSRLTIAKVNADENRPLSRRYVQKGLPTLLLFHRGELVDVLHGAPPPAELRAWVLAHLDRLIPASAGSAMTPTP